MCEKWRANPDSKGRNNAANLRKPINNNKKGPAQIVQKRQKQMKITDYVGSTFHDKKDMTPEVQKLIENLILRVIVEQESNN